MNKDEQIADRELSPLIKFAEKNPGTITKVTARLEKLMGSKVHRQLVEKWLHPDPAKRTQPRFGVGLLLMKVRDEIKGHEIKPGN